MADVQKIYDAKARELSGIFGDPNAYYEVPDYQRPYRWDSEQIQALWDDIYSAYKENRSAYFLGSIIVAKGEQNYKEVIDGQQRLTTLVILFCTIRDLYFNRTDIKPDPISINAVNDSIKSLRGNAYRLRLKTQSNYQTEFEQEILGGIKFLDKRVSKGKKSSFVTAVMIFKDNLVQNFGDDVTQLSNFVNYLFSNVVMVIIECTDRSSAIKLFQILNTRGMPLLNSDLIKSYLYKELDESKKSEFKATWIQTEELAKTMKEELDNLFTYYEYYLLASNPENSLYEELEAQFNGKDPIEVLYNFKKFVENLDDLDKTKSKEINSLRYLRNQVFWKAILLTAKKEEFEQIDELIKELKRFFYCYWIAGYTTSKIKQTAFNLIGQIKAKKSMQDIKSEIEKKFYQDRVLSRMSEGLNSENVYEERWLKPLLLLIEDERTDSSKATFYELKKLDADHILPHGWRKIDDWTKDWNEDDANALINRLGNLTLIIYDKNRSAQHCPFNEKKDIYKGLGRYAKKTAFLISQEVTQESVWKKEQVINRQKNLISEIQGILDIDFSKAASKENITVSNSTTYWITPVSDDQDGSAIETINRLVGESKIWAFSESSIQRNGINLGDYICFYASGIGIVAHAKVSSEVRNEINPNIKEPEKYHYIIDLSDVNLYLDRPIPLDLNTRQKMPSFSGKDPNNWSWFVQTTRKVSRNEFNILTGKSDNYQSEEPNIPTEEVELFEDGTNQRTISDKITKFLLSLPNVEIAKVHKRGTYEYSAIINGREPKDNFAAICKVNDDVVLWFLYPTNLSSNIKKQLELEKASPWYYTTIKNIDKVESLQSYLEQAYKVYKSLSESNVAEPTPT